MSDNESSFWSIIPLWIRLLIFMVLLIVAGPFLAIGSSKNSSIEKSMKKGVEYVGQGNFIDACKEFENAAAQFGVLYDAFKLALNVTGGTYYKQNVCFMMRGVARTGAICEKMGNGETDVEAEIKEARKDLSITKDISNTLERGRQSAIEELDKIERVKPLLILCKQGKHGKAMKDFETMVQEKFVPIGEMAGMATCYLLSECAVNLKDASTIRMAKKICLVHSEKFKYPIFQKLAFKVTALTAQEAAPAKTSIEVALPKELKARFSLAMSMAQKKDFQKALPIFESCYKENPKNVDYIYFFALAQTKVGKIEVAKKLCQEVIAIKPDHKGANKILIGN